MKPRFRILVYILLLETISMPLRANVWDTVKDVGGKVLPTAINTVLSSRNPSSSSGATDQSFLLPLEKMGCNVRIDQIGVPQCPEGENAISIDPSIKQQTQFAQGSLQNIQNGLAQCMRNKDKILTTLFDNNIRDINLKWNDIEKEHSEFTSEALIPFKENLEKDYNALYTGNGIEYSKIYNKPSCRSIATTNAFDKNGSNGSGGLRKLLEANEEVIQNQEKFASDPALPTRINNFIRDVARKAQSGGLGAFQKQSLIQIDGSDELSGSPTYKDAFGKLQDQYADSFTENINTLKEYVGGTAYEGIISKLSPENIDTIDIDKEVKVWKNESEVKCFYSSLEGGQDSFVKIFNSVYDKDRKITHDNTTYKTGDSSPTSEISRKVSSILENNQVSLRSKIINIKKYIYDPRYRRDETYVRLGSDYSGQGASYKWNPYKLILQFYKNCQSGVSSQNTINNKKIGSVISKVKEVASKIKADKKNLAKNIQNTLRNTLINCQSDNTAMSGDFCSASNKPFSLSGNFCLKKAKKCSKNVDQCLGQIEKDYTNTRAALHKNVTDYNKTITQYVKKRRADILAMQDVYENTFKTIETFGVTRDTQGDFGYDKINDIITGKNHDTSFSEIEADLGIKLHSLDDGAILELFKKQKDVLVKRLEATRDKFEEKMDKELEMVGAQIAQKNKALESCVAAISSAAGLVKEHYGNCRTVASSKSATTSQVEAIIESYESLPESNLSQKDQEAIQEDIDSFNHIKEAIEGLSEELPGDSQKICLGPEKKACFKEYDEFEKCLTGYNKDEKTICENKNAVNKAGKDLKAKLENSVEYVGGKLADKIKDYSKDIDICKQTSAQDSTTRTDGKWPTGDEIDQFLKQINFNSGRGF